MIHTAGASPPRTPQASLGAAVKHDGLISASASLRPKPLDDGPRFALAEISLYLVHN